MRLNFLRHISGKCPYLASRIDRLTKVYIAPALGRCCTISETHAGLDASSGMRIPRIKLTHNAFENKLRLVVAHDPDTAATQTRQRNERVDDLIRRADEWSGKLDRQDTAVKHRGRKLSDSGAKARFFHAVAEAHLSRVIKVDLKSDLFSYDIDETARSLAELMDGKLLLVTNTPQPMLTPTEETAPSTTSSRSTADLSAKVVVSTPDGTDCSGYECCA